MRTDAREQFRRAYSIARRASRKTGEQRDLMWRTLHSLPDPMFAVINEAVHRRHCADPLRQPAGEQIVFVTSTGAAEFRLASRITGRELRQ